jgi:ribosomal protein S1
MLSRRRILFAQAWEKVTQLYADDAVVEGEVAAVNRGGAMMVVEGLRAFLPGSHFLAGQTPTEGFIGQKLQVKFLDVDKETSRLVVSHRKAVVDSQINDLNVGSVLKGVITAVKPYGAFVDIGGMSGLLHISQISCDHISNVESVVPVGTAIKCMVISQDKGKGRVALSTKTLEQEPGDMIRDQAKVFDNAEDTAAKYQERIAAERKAREEAAQDVIFGLESVFTEPADAPAEPSSAPDEPAAPADLPLEA